MRSVFAAIAESMAASGASRMDVEDDFTADFLDGAVVRAQLADARSLGEVPCPATHEPLTGSCRACGAVV